MPVRPRISIPMTLLLLGLSAFPAGATDIATMEQSLRTNPANPQLWLQLGLAYRDAHNLDQAQNAFQRVLNLEPQNPDALYMLGLIYEKKGQTQEALRSWRQYLIVEKDPARRAIAEKHVHLLSQ
jgi:cytochrome c-type biogenesis protein CcmH/NrfG